MTDVEEPCRNRRAGQGASTSVETVKYEGYQSHSPFAQRKCSPWQQWQSENVRSSNPTKSGEASLYPFPLSRIPTPCTPFSQWDRSLTVRGGTCAADLMLRLLSESGQQNQDFKTLCLLGQRRGCPCAGRPAAIPLPKARSPAHLVTACLFDSSLGFSARHYWHWVCIILCHEDCAVL